MDVSCSEPCIGQSEQLYSQQEQDEYNNSANKFAATSASIAVAGPLTAVLNLTHVAESDDCVQKSQECPSGPRASQPRIAAGPCELWKSS